MHSLDNLRGIPKGLVDNQVHKSQIRKFWDNFYDKHPPGVATKNDFLRARDELDKIQGKHFLPKRGKQ